MKLFYGTGNQSKLRNMRAILAGMPIELVTPADLGIQLPAVEETGATPLENAALKAEAYHAVSGLPSFSLDSGLYLDLNCLYTSNRRSSYRRFSLIANLVDYGL